MYPVIRRIHLIAGLILLVWIFMYFVTGLPIIHESWMKKADPIKTIRTETLALSGTPNEPEFWDTFEETYQIRGKRGKAEKRGNGEWKMVWTRPGTGYEARITADGTKAIITHLQHGPRNVLVGLHRQHGYGGGWLYNIYALFLDLSALAVILFAVSGVYLWCLATQNRVPGFICLGVACLFTGVVIHHLMTHP